jgi:sialidase-1
MTATPQVKDSVHRTDLWVAGEGGYHTYRIPALTVGRGGTLLAFCEGRKHSRADAGEIDLLLRRSTDGGRTWLPTQIVVTDPGFTCGNPAPVLDRDTGVIWLPFCKNPADGGEAQIRKGLAERTVWLTHSADDGATWTEPTEITFWVKRPDWTWYATGPCHGIQLSSGPAAGRLLIPCDHRVRLSETPSAPSAASASTTPSSSTSNSSGAVTGVATGDPNEARYSHVIYSDDHGTNWQIGGIVREEGTNECAALELPGGNVYLNCRDQAKRGRRCVAGSRDGGLTFPEHRFDDTLIEPACQGSLATLADGRALFCNPASATRDTLTIRLSDDHCHSWRLGRILEPGPAAYSDLAVTSGSDGHETVWCLYERGTDSPYERLTLASFDPAWLAAGAT